MIKQIEKGAEVRWNGLKGTVMAGNLDDEWTTDYPWVTVGFTNRTLYGVKVVPANECTVVEVTA